MKPIRWVWCKDEHGRRFAILLTDQCEYVALVKQKLIGDRLMYIASSDAWGNPSPFENCMEAMQWCEKRYAEGPP